jgi:hypothetical protein
LLDLYTSNRYFEFNDHTARAPSRSVTSVTPLKEVGLTLDTLRNDLLT